MENLDKAINAYRGDIAAASLIGKVQSEKFVEAKTYQIKVPIAQLRNAPLPNAEHSTQALLGELIDVYEIKDGFAWGQLKRDSYVGYLAESDIGEEIIAPTHKMGVMRTNSYTEAKVQAQIKHTLTFGALICASETRENGFVWCDGLGFIYESHLCPIDKKFDDPIDLAKQMLWTPYVWGGNSPLGIDCSGLVQLCYGACGIELPRDARLQEARGQSLEINDDLSGLRRGDLIFWKGHVAIMMDEVNIIHATSFTMMVSIEPLKVAKERIDNLGIPIRSIKRLF